MSTLEGLIREKVKNSDFGEEIASDDDFEIDDFDENV